jgi:hypothetical protein
MSCRSSLLEPVVHLVEPVVDLLEPLVDLAELPREEIDELLVLAGRHGTCLPQATGPFKCVRLWTREDLPRPAPVS